MGFWSWTKAVGKKGLEIAKEFALNSFLPIRSMLPPRVIRFGQKFEKLATKVIDGYLGKGRDKKEPIVSRPTYPYSDLAEQPPVIKGDFKEKEKGGIIPEIWDTAKEVLPIAAALATVGYTIEQILEYAGVREGAGLVGAKTSDLAPIGRGRGKMAAPRKKRKKGHTHKVHVKRKKHVRVKQKHGKRGHTHLKHKKVRKHKKIRHTHKKKKKSKKKGKRVSFVTKGGKRVSFISRR